MAKSSTSKKITIHDTRKGVEIREDGVTFAVIPIADRALAEAAVTFRLTRSQIIWLLYSEQ